MNIDQLTVELLLDKNEVLLAKLSDICKRHYDVVSGRACPVCNGPNVDIGNECGDCRDCNETFDIDTSLSISFRRVGGKISEIEKNSH